MKKYSEQVKLAAVQAYVSGELGWKATAKLHNVEPSSLRKWVAAHEVHGVEGVRDKRRTLYSTEFKLKVPQRMQGEHLSYGQAAALFDIRNFNIIGAWERAYERDLKSEFFHLNEFSSLEELEAGLDDYIRYYNDDRIKLKLKGLNPMDYRKQFVLT